MSKDEGGERARSPYRPGVGIMLLNDKNRVFVAQRIDFPGDAWQMPQGGIDPGESPLRAALRELKEEIGTDKAVPIAETKGWLSYEVPAELSRRLWRGRYRGQRQKWFLMRFTGKDADIDLATEHPEFSAWKWVGPAELPRLIVPFKRQLYLDLLEQFAEQLDIRG
ncbi:MAG TPA: RNA pyrophosphohydrolase [Stellaceae bacterium]|nr:RNA pyrophosphohydrolase [Stellaceae bacterium]